MKMKNENNQKDIHFLLSNGTQLQMIHTSVFKAHLKAIQIINQAKWNLEIIEIQINKIWSKKEVKRILG
jgi:hypothetical protein